MANQEPKRDYSEPTFSKLGDRKKYPFYHVNIDHKIPPETKELLQKYSGVPKEQQSQHVHQIRDRAFGIRAYPCTGLGSWLTPQLCRQPIYPQILHRAKDGAVVLDIGTFIGHDLRRLAFDGAPSDRLYGLDIVSHFDVGYDFFRDREHFKGHFIEADLFSSSDSKLNQLKGCTDIIIASQLLHQWDWDNQVRAAQTLSTFTKPGSIIVGNQLGNVEAREIELKTISRMPVWRHDPDSFAKMWTQVGQETGTKWETQASLKTVLEMGWDQQDASWLEHDVRLIEFAVTRIA